MKYNLLRILICLILIPNLNAQEVTITGVIHGFNNKKVTVRYDEYNLLLNRRKRKVVKTDNFGQFQVSIEDLRYISIMNRVKIGSEWIYLCLSPGDSISIIVDSDELSNVVFGGDFSTRNKFVNDYQHMKDQQKFIPGSTDPDIKFAIYQNYNKADTAMLFKYESVLELDQYFCNYFEEVIKYQYFNTMNFYAIDSVNYYNAVSKEFDVNNPYLTYDIGFYSAMTGYFEKTENIDFNFYDIDSLRSNMDFVKNRIKEPNLKCYQAYMLGHFIYRSLKMERKEENFKSIVQEFISECNDPVLLGDLQQLLKEKKVNL